MGSGEHTPRPADGPATTGGWPAPEDAEVAELVQSLGRIRNRALNVLGHELRTPVTTVRGLADALAALGHDADETTRTTLVDAVQRNAHRVERLLDNLLAALEVGTAMPVGPTVSVLPVAVAQAVWADPEGPLRDGELKVDGDADVEVAVRLESLKRILWEILDNASRYGTSPTTLRVDTVEGVDGALGLVVLTIDSPGRPLAPEDIRYATQALWRGESAVTSTPGLGLGLAVADALARHEHGSLVVEGLAAGGLRTVLTLPMGAS